MLCPISLRKEPYHSQTVGFDSVKNNLTNFNSRIFSRTSFLKKYYFSNYFFLRPLVTKLSFHSLNSALFCSLEGGHFKKSNNNVSDSSSLPSLNFHFPLRLFPVVIKIEERSLRHEMFPTTRLSIKYFPYLPRASITCPSLLLKLHPHPLPSKYAHLIPHDRFCILWSLFF